MSRDAERKTRVEANGAPGMVISAGTSESEAAAVVAAIEQFLADTASPPAPEGPAISPWARAALEEGIAARQVSGYVWGHAPRPA